MLLCFEDEAGVKVNIKQGKWKVRLWQEPRSPKGLGRWWARNAARAVWTPGLCKECPDEKYLLLRDMDACSIIARSGIWAPLFVKSF